MTVFENAPERERKAVRAAAENFRENPAFDAKQAITELGTGEALVSLLDAKSVPRVVDRALVRPPRSRLGPALAAERRAALAASPLAGETVTLEAVVTGDFQDNDGDTLPDAWEALGVNASMLLLSPHHMALHSSPSQLDAVERILRQQLEAVQEARQIHRRLQASARNHNNS